MVAALAAALSLVSFAAPELPKLPEIKREPQITYVDRSGAVLGVRGGKYAPPVNLASLPAYVPAAFVSIEDRRFYEHQGVDALGIARALVADAVKGRAAQGASTITQQLARNLFLTNDRNLERKATEALYAIQLERTFTKQQILGLYLSRANFGKGAWGLEAAAERYFDKPARALTIREAATLAAIMKAPSNYNPVDAPEKSAERTRLVLDAMVETGAISAGQRSRALAENPKVWKSAPSAPAQYFIDWIDGETHKLIGAPKQDIVVDTTLDLPSEQAAAEQARTVVAHYSKQKVEQTALVTLDAQGRVRAMLGGVDYEKSPFNRAVDAHRQAGSSWKPFVYLTAMEAGLTPDTVRVDEPITIANWSPQNIEGEGFSGPVTLQVALAQSINTVAARVADEIGRPNIAATAKRLGITTQINTDPAMALGTSLVEPIEMAEAYAAFADGGAKVAAYGVERIRTTSGQLVYQRKPAPQAQVIANPALGELTGMMRTVLTQGTGRRAAIPGYDLAGKTGTTSDYKDAWFCGFTGGLTTVVWMGRDDNTPMRKITGGIAPAELWRDYMRIALKKLPSAPIPAGPPAPAPEPATIPVSAPGPATPPADDISNLLGAPPQPPPTTLLPLPPPSPARPG
ncbi:MAG TPA: PBP1A family penicillin-binding protein [Caulobacteraceae bacterium]